MSARPTTLRRGREARARTRPRGRRVPVAAAEPLLGGARYDYADAFEIAVSPSDGRTAEAFMRSALANTAWPLLMTISLVHRRVLRLELAPASAPDHLFGWRIVTSEPDVIHVEATSPVLGRGAIVGRRVARNRYVFTTYLFHTRPALARAVWLMVGPLHRTVAPHLLQRAVAR